MRNNNCQPHKLSDYTNWSHFAQRFGLHVLVCFDHALWTVVNFFCLMAIFFLALLLGAWDCAKAGRKVITRPLYCARAVANAPQFLSRALDRFVTWLLQSAGPLASLSARVLQLAEYVRSGIRTWLTGPAQAALWWGRTHPLGLLLMPAKAAQKILRNWTRKWPAPPAKGAGRSTLSAVNAETPNIHSAYCRRTFDDDWSDCLLFDQPAKDDDRLFDDDDEKFDGANSRYDFTSIDLAKVEFDLGNAIFFLHLSALVYESQETLDASLKQWHLRYEPIIHGEGYTGCSAWVIYHSHCKCQAEEELCKRPNQDFLVVVFKGTSPFNCVDWMTDFTMLKIKPYGESLPGMIHEGFFKEFEWPLYLKPIKGEHIRPPTPNSGYVCHKREIHQRLGKDGNSRPLFHPPLSFYERLVRKINHVILVGFLKSDSKAALWITGHSLGGALASIFFAHLLHVPKPYPLMITPKSWLKGGYTFGAPRTGDARYANAVRRHWEARHFYDVINANDGVHWVPVAQDLQCVLRDERALTNFAHIGKPVLLNHWGTHSNVHGASTWGRIAKGIFSHIGSFVCHWLSLPCYLWRMEVPAAAPGGLPGQHNSNYNGKDDFSPARTEEISPMRDGKAQEREKA